MTSFRYFCKPLQCVPLPQTSSINILWKNSKRIFTWMLEMSSWNGKDFSDHVVISSTALSKFFTYSLYIFRKGATFWMMSPILGLESLQAEAKRTGLLLASLERQPKRSREDALGTACLPLSLVSIAMPKHRWHWFVTFAGVPAGWCPASTQF